MMTKKSLSVVLSSLISCACSGGAKKVRSSNGGKQTESVYDLEKSREFVEKFRKFIRENPVRFVLYSAAILAIAGDLCINILDFFEDDDKVFEGIYNQLKAAHHCGDDPIEVMNALILELHNVQEETYSLPRTVLRRLKDFFLMRGATTRQRKSAERILYNGKAEGYGSCWELANIVDWFCRKLGFERHNIITYKLFPGIYHTFNFFVCKGKAYLADPLGGVIKVLELKNGSLLESLRNFKDFQLYSRINPGYGDWYAVEQIEDNTCRTLGMMKMAKFFPNMSDGSRLFECKKPKCEDCKKNKCLDKYTNINIEEFDTNDKSSFIIKTSDGKLVLNGKDNIKFDSFSSLIYG